MELFDNDYKFLRLIVLPAMAILRKFMFWNPDRLCFPSPGPRKTGVGGRNKIKIKKKTRYIDVQSNEARCIGLYIGPI